MVFVVSIYTYSQSWSMTPFNYNMNGADFKSTTLIMSGKKIRVADKIYLIYATMLCGTVSDVIMMHVFEVGSFVSLQSV